jgi:acetyl-CoA acetyltransferase
MNEASQAWLRNKVAIVGYAQTPIERHAAASLGVLTLGAARAAIADAGMQPADVDGLVTVSGMPSLGAHTAEDGITSVSVEWLIPRLGAHPTYAANVSGVGQLPNALATAVNVIASGAARTVLVYRALYNPVGSYTDNPMRHAADVHQWTAPQGYFGPIAAVALPAMEYAQRYGMTRDALAAVAVEARRNGAAIPWSCWYGRPLDVAEHLAADTICDPISRFDCDLPIDGVAAFLLTSAEHSRSLPNRPVLISGYVTGAAPRRGLLLHWTLDDIVRGGAEVVRRLHDTSGLAPDGVDLAQVYDGFSPFVLFWLEALGYCPRGEAHRFVLDGGIDSASPKARAVLSGGGSLGNGRMHGVAQLLECYLQLAGRAGARQRAAATAIATYGPPNTGGAIALTAGD